MPDPVEPTSSTPVVESAPAAPSTSPAEAFHSDAPNWVKSDPKLLAAHEAAKPEAPAQPVTTPAATPAATPATTPAATPGSLPQFDEQRLASLITAGVRAGQPAASAAAESDADVARKLNIYTADAATFEAIVGLKPERPEQVVALNNALQGVARQAVTIAKILIDQSVGDLRTSISPYQQMVQRQVADQQQALFYDENKELVGYKPLVESTFAAMKASGITFTDITTARKALADRVRADLKASGITPQVARPGTPTRTTTTPQSRPMSPTSMGGRNGGQSPTKPASTMESVWGNK